MHCVNELDIFFKIFKYDEIQFMRSILTVSLN
jgi:hypothetical protein